MIVELVGGTWAFGPGGEIADWLEDPGTGFVPMLRSKGVELARARRFEWSGDLNGHLNWLKWLGLGWLPVVKRAGSDWRAGGAALDYYLEPVVGLFVLVVHSHALQLALHCAARGRYIPVLISVGGPIREDMRGVLEAALPNIGAWLQISGEGSDRVQAAGGVGDGHVGILRRPPASWLHGSTCRFAFAPVDGIEHSRVLNEPKRFAERWDHWFAWASLELELEARKVGV